MKKLLLRQNTSDRITKYTFIDSKSTQQTIHTRQRRTTTVHYIERYHDINVDLISQTVTVTKYKKEDEEAKRRRKVRLILIICMYYHCCYYCCYCIIDTILLFLTFLLPVVSCHHHEQPKALIALLYTIIYLIVM